MPLHVRYILCPEERKNAVRLLTLVVLVHNATTLSDQLVSYMVSDPITVLYLSSKLLNVHYSNVTSSV